MRRGLLLAAVLIALGGVVGFVLRSKFSHAVSEPVRVIVLHDHKGGWRPAGPAYVVHEDLSSYVLQLMTWRGL